jgi:hypothetical protein
MNVLKVLQEAVATIFRTRQNNSRAEPIAY